MTHLYPTEIIKRDGKRCKFDQIKIQNAILAAAKSVKGKVMENEGVTDGGESTSNPLETLSQDITQAVVSTLDGNTTVEAVQDAVEAALLKAEHVEIARSYISYRQTHEKIRAEKCSILETDTLDKVACDFPLSSLRVMATRYLNRDDKGHIIETPSECLKRVAVAAGIGDFVYEILKIYGAVQQTTSSNEVDKSPEIISDSYYTQLIQDTLKYTETGGIESTPRLYKMGEFNVNQWHIRSLARLYVRKLKEYSSNNNNSQKSGTLPSFAQVVDMLEGEFGADIAERFIKPYYDMLASRTFMPNSPTLMNAGGRLGQLSACFVLGMDDSLKSIMKTASDATMIYQSGGGVGINYGALRERNSRVGSTSGVASGPVSFMNIINTITDVVKQGGRRRGANMGVMPVYHPDIEEFITAKTKPGVLENFNVSVGMDEDFWCSYKSIDDEKKNMTLYRQPVHGDINEPEPKGEINTDYLMNIIAESAWRSAEPGVLFFDNANKANVLKKLHGDIVTTNPCGEQFMYSYESCNLGSLNMIMFMQDGEFLWGEYANAIQLCTQFLDNIIDVNHYPIKEIDEASQASRRVGIGVMGVADVLMIQGVGYASEKGLKMHDRLAEYLTYESMCKSVELAKERGVFPLFEKTSYKDGMLPVNCLESLWDPAAFNKGHLDCWCDWTRLQNDIQKYGIRNVVTTTVAPTGTISMIAGCSSGIEPIYALIYKKDVTVGDFEFVNPQLEKEDCMTPEILAKVRENKGSVRGVQGLPENMYEIYATAMDIHWADHIHVQSIWQKWISNSISKTINMPSNSTIQDVKNAYEFAHGAGCKGITIYRDGSRETQVLSSIGDSSASPPEPTLHTAKYMKQILHKPPPAKVPTNGGELQEADPIVVNYGGGSDVGVGGCNTDACASTPDLSVTASVIEDTEIPKLRDESICPNCDSKMAFVEGCRTCYACGLSMCSV